MQQYASYVLRKNVIIMFLWSSGRKMTKPFLTQFLFDFAIIFQET